MNLISPHENLRLLIEKKTKMAKTLKFKSPCSFLNQRIKYWEGCTFDSTGAITFPMLEGILDISNTYWRNHPLSLLHQKELKTSTEYSRRVIPSFSHTQIHLSSLQRKCRLAIDQVSTLPLQAEKSVKLMSSALNLKIAN